jgi:RimJ/RimL family protein N-acetyltransferase
MIHGRLIDLRPVRAADLAVLRRWEHDPQIDRWLATTVYALDARESQEQEFERLLRTPRVKIVVIQTKAEAIVGFIRLNDIDWQAHKASLRLFILPEMQNKGYGSDALRTLLHFCFTEMGLHRLGLTVLESNKRALAVYQRLGFVVEGCERESVWSAGRWQNMLHMGLLAHEWNEESE